MDIDIETIINTVKKIKVQYTSDGLLLMGIFGSYARGDADEYSDIDIAYDIDYDMFFDKYQDGFSELLRIEELKNHLELALHKKVDLIPFKSTNKKLKNNIEKDLVYV